MSAHSWDEDGPEDRGATPLRDGPRGDGPYGREPREDDLHKTDSLEREAEEALRSYRSHIAEVEASQEEPAPGPSHHFDRDRPAQEQDRRDDLRFEPAEPMHPSAAEPAFASERHSEGGESPQSQDKEPGAYPEPDEIAEAPHHRQPGYMPPSPLDALNRVARPQERQAQPAFRAPPLEDEPPETARLDGSDDSSAPAEEPSGASEADAAAAEAADWRNTLKSLAGDDDRPFAETDRETSAETASPFDGGSGGHAPSSQEEAAVGAGFSETERSGSNGGHFRRQATRDELLKYYQDMLLIRRFEEKAGQMYGMGLIGGFCHLYIGQEAVVVGMQAVIEEGDQVITGYRDHGHMLACGMDSRGVMAELTGRSGGYSKGKGGSMHMFSVEKNFYGGHGIVGAQVPIGSGLAFANKYLGTDRVCLTYFGDGAANQGQVYESFNMAELWRLPVIYVIENNQYAMGTSVERASAETHLCRRGVSFNIPGRQVNGMDVLAVRDAGAEAVEWCRAGNGPVILEMKTYRYRGHSMSDPAKYRSREEVQEVRERQDPIELVKKHLIENGFADEAALKEIDKQVRSQVNDAADFARESPEPGPEELWTDVLAEE